MSFNPANFPWTNPLPAAAQAPAGSDTAILEIAGDLKAAAQRFARRTDDFARGKADTCLDIAAKLERFGSFASEKQADFARKLIDWSIPRWERERAPLQTLDQIKPAAPAPLALPKLAELFQRFAKLEIGKLKLTRENGGDRIWVRHADADKCVAVINGDGSVTLWARPGIDQPALRKDLLAIEADPEAACVLHGRLSGRCAVCSRDLTDPESIARGIGPICAEKF